QYMFAGEEHALEVEIDLRVPDFLAHFHRSAMGRTADIVHQHVDATEPVEAGFCHRGDRAGVGDVARMHDDFAAHRLHAFDGFLRAVGIAVHREDFRAFLREADGGGAAVAPARADAAGPGDDGNAVLQTSGHGSFPLYAKP